MMRNLSSRAVAAALAFIPLAASAAITAGTVLTANRDQSIDSKGAQVGQRFTMSNVHSQDNNINNAKIYGHVCDVQTAGQGTPGKIQLCFDKLVTASGGSYTLDGRATDVKVVTKNNTVNEVGGAVAGMILGNIVGKKLGTNVGGLL